ncbi:MAG: hypothetical protein LBS21_06395, partial [Clostridiales bacterium]|jgi:hypothetical protein|nr:hypothetical protein [Clostridiales bacterium]
LKIRDFRKKETLNFQGFLNLKSALFYIFYGFSGVGGRKSGYEEYKRDLNNFTADLTELPIAETEIRYDYMNIFSPYKLFPVLVYNYIADSEEQLKIYAQYLKEIEPKYIPPVKIHSQYLKENVPEDLAPPKTLGEEDIEAILATEGKILITAQDIKPDRFVYPDKPLTPENLSYIVSGALEKLMAEEDAERKPPVPEVVYYMPEEATKRELPTYEVVLLDINFDNFPEMVFKLIEGGGANKINKVYSLKKENFGEFLLDFEVWDEFTADLTELPFAETKIEYNHVIIENKPFIPRPALIYSTDSQENLAIYARYLESFGAE